MNLQIERIENHKARLSAEIEPAKFESAKRKAARKISRQVTIRGFRKGKAPYSRVARTVGEATIIEEAVDDLTQETYRQALDESKVEPFGNGALEDVKLDPPTFIFTVPMRPVVDLCDFREVRVEYDEPIVDETDVDLRLHRFKVELTEVLDEEVETAQMGHRVYVDIDSEFLDDYVPPSADEIVDADETDWEEPALEAPAKGDAYFRQKDMAIILDPADGPFMDGFVEELVGAQPGDDMVFELAISDDDAEPIFAGRRVKFAITVNRIEAIDVPEMDEDFVRKVNERRDEQVSDLAALRSSLLEELTRNARNTYDDQYSQQVLFEIVAGADIQYPAVAVDYQIDSQVGEFRSRVAQQGVDFADYMRISNMSEADLREQFRDEAQHRVQRNLVMGKLLEELGADVEDEDIEMRFLPFTANLPQFSADSPEYARFREMIKENVEMAHMQAKLVALGRGEDMSAAVEALRAETLELQRNDEARESNQESQDEAPVDAPDTATESAAVSEAPDGSEASAPEVVSES